MAARGDEGRPSPARSIVGARPDCRQRRYRQQDRHLRSRCPGAERAWHPVLRRRPSSTFDLIARRAAPASRSNSAIRARSPDGFGPARPPPMGSTPTTPPSTSPRPRPDRRDHRLERGVIRPVSANRPSGRFSSCEPARPQRLLFQLKEPTDANRPRPARCHCKKYLTGPPQHDLLRRRHARKPELEPPGEWPAISTWLHSISSSPRAPITTSIRTRRGIISSSMRARTTGREFGSSTRSWNSRPLGPALDCHPAGPPVVTRPGRRAGRARRRRPNRGRDPRPSESAPRARRGTARPRGPLPGPTRS